MMKDMMQEEELKQLRDVRVQILRMSAAQQVTIFGRKIDPLPCKSFRDELLKCVTALRVDASRAHSRHTL
eukprot:2766584-Prymnesium_polylepis.1